MNGIVTSYMWHQITNQIPDWCKREITRSIFDLCHLLTGGEKWKKKKKKKGSHIFDTTSGNYVCCFIDVGHLEVLIIFPIMTSSGDVQSGKLTDKM